MSIRGVAVAIFSFRFHVCHLPVGYRLTVCYLTFEMKISSEVRF